MSVCVTRIANLEKPIHYLWSPKENEFRTAGEGEVYREIYYLSFLYKEIDNFLARDDDFGSWPEALACHSLWGAR